MTLRHKLASLAGILLLVGTVTYLSLVFTGSPELSPVSYRANHDDKVTVMIGFKQDQTWTNAEATDWGEQYDLLFGDAVVPGKLFYFYYFEPLTSIDLLKELRQDPDVDIAEFDKIVQPDFTPDDPQLGSSWHLNSLSFKTAWDKSMGQNVPIAIIDSGVDCTHPDLAASCVPGWNFYNNNSNTSDVYGHGTTVAGAAAEIANNTTNTAGAAGKALIRPVRVTGTNGSASSLIILQAIMWVADQGGKVANVSFLIADTSAFKYAAEYMYNKGGVVVASAGNQNANLTYDNSPYDLVVAGTDSNNVKAGWSNYGIPIDVAAPGEGILTTANGGGIGGASGTSYSSPITAAVAAMLYAVKPTITPARVIGIIKESATDLGAAGRDDIYGNGLINPLAAVNQAIAEGGTAINPQGESSPPPPEDPVSPPVTTPPPNIENETIETPTPINETTQQPVAPKKKSTPKTKATTPAPTEPVPTPEPEPIVDEVKEIGVELTQPENPQLFSQVRVKGKTAASQEVELLVLPLNKKFTEKADANGDVVFVLDKQLAVGSYTASAKVISHTSDLPYSNSITIEVAKESISVLSNLIVSTTAGGLGVLIFLFHDKLLFILRRILQLP